MSATKESGAFNCFDQQLQKCDTSSSPAVQDQSHLEHVEPWILEDPIGFENKNNFSQVHPYFEQIIFPDLVRKMSFARKQSKYVPSRIIVGKKMEKLIDDQFWNLRPMPTHNIPRPKVEQNFAFIYSEMEKIKVPRPKPRSLNSYFVSSDFTELDNLNKSFMNSSAEFETVVFPALVKKVGCAMKHNKHNSSIVEQKMKTYREMKTFLDLRFWENNDCINKLLK